MNKQDWIKLCRFTAKASGKKRLNKQDRINLMKAQIALGNFKPKEKVVKETWTPAPQEKPVDSIAQILKTIQRPQEPSKRLGYPT